MTVVHCKREPYDVYIGRPSKWGNPFTIGPHGTRAEVIAKYEQWITQQPELMADLPELRNKTLGCWCAPLVCHGNVLERLALTGPQQHGKIVSSPRPRGTERRKPAMAEQFSAKEVALEFKTDARTLRKFLREHLGEGKAVVGQGGRYSFTKKEVTKLRKAFEAWSAGTLKTTAKKTDKVDEGVADQDETDRTTEEIDVDDDGEVIDLEDLDEPDEDELDDEEDEDFEILDDED